MVEGSGVIYWKGECNWFEKVKENTGTFIHIPVIYNIYNYN